METSTPPNLPPAIESKISDVSYDNAIWHTDFCKQDTSAKCTTRIYQYKLYFISFIIYETMKEIH